MKQETLEAVELDLLFDAIHRWYGLDYRDYARNSARRRVWKRIQAESLGTISALTEKVLHDPACLERLLLDLSVHVTSMFRDPGFFRAFRQKVVPVLRTYPFTRIWHVGCATGEEVYSMAILLHEEELYEKCRIYATDVNAKLVQRAEEGILPLAAMEGYAADYIRAGGTSTLSDYYTSRYEMAILKPWLRNNVVFAQHNLVTDAGFNEFNAILCRNVLIYFNKALQERTHRLICESLGMFGFLGLGKKESLKMTPLEGYYEEFDPAERLYRKVRQWESS